MKKKGEYYVNRHSCFLLQYHLVLVTKYRHKVMTGACRERMLALIEEFFADREEPVSGLEVCADHIHVLFEAPPTERLSELVNALKTKTARIIRKEFQEELKPFYWKPLFWSDSYFVATVSDRTKAAVQQYIATQDIKS